MTELFKNNVNALQKVDEPLSKAMSQLESMGLDAPLHFVKTDDGNLFDAIHKELMYKDLRREIDEKKNLFDENYPKHPVIFLFGFGNGALIEHLLKNSNHKRIIVFESELDTIFYALHEFEWDKDIRKERLIPFYVPNLNPAQLGTLFSYKDIGESVKTYNFTSSCEFYDTYHKETIQEVNQKLMENVQFAFIRKGNDPMDSIVGIEHTLQHLPQMLAHPSLRDLLRIRQKASKNAVVVSTGPSLVKQLPLLKKYADSVAIFCADSAYAILHKHGIKPDYVLSLERFDPTSELFNYDFGEFDKDIIFVVASVTHPNTIKFFERNHRKYIIAFRPGLFSKFLKLDEFGYIGVHHSVSNMSFELAAYLGCENIFLIGQDLSYSNEGKSHPKEYKYAVNEEVDFQKVPNLPEITAYGGVGKVKTKPVWMLFKQGLENDIVMAAIRYKSTAYNCTEGGARIDGAIEIPFKQACEQFFTQKVKKPFENVPNLDEKGVKALLDKTKKHLSSALKKSELYLDEIRKELEILTLLLPRDYVFEKLDFKALKKSKQRLVKLYSKFVKSTIFTEVLDVTYYHLNCELVKLDCIVCKDEEAEKRWLVKWLSAVANWFIEVGEYIYTQDERIQRYMKEW